MGDIDRSKWEIDDSGRAIDENGEDVFRGIIRLNFSVRETTEQIVREHNAHEGLVETVEELINCLKGHSLEDCDISAIEDAKAVLARAEGR
jgi:hypothetical protein